MAHYILTYNNKNSIDTFKGGKIVKLETFLEGVDGATWISGSGAPDNADGNDNDFYLDRNGDYYLKVEGAWELQGNLNGADAVVKVTSTSSVAIAAGSKTFTYTEVTNLGWAIGTRLRAAYSSGGSSKYMEGIITAVSTTSVTINVDNYVGSSTYASWDITIAGDKGATGATGPTGATGATGASGSTTIKTVSSNSTSAIAATKLHSLYIPANTWASGDLIHLESFFAKTNTNNSSTVAIWHNTSDTLSGATQIATLAIAATTRTSGIVRRLAVTGASTQTTMNTTVGQNDQMGIFTNSAFSSLSINTAVDNYILVSGLVVNTSDVIAAQWSFTTKF